MYATFSLESQNCLRFIVTIISLEFSRPNCKPVCGISSALLLMIVCYTVSTGFHKLLSPVADLKIEACNTEQRNLFLKLYSKNIACASVTARLFNQMHELAS